MATALSDGSEGDHLVPLPISVERVIGAALPEMGELDEAALVTILKKADEYGTDSNFDHVSSGFDFDVVVDGTRAVRVLVDALRRRQKAPVREHEKVCRVSTSR